MGQYMLVLCFLLVFFTGCSNNDQKQSVHKDMKNEGEEEVEKRMLDLKFEVNIIQDQAQFIINLTNKSKEEKELEFSSSQKYEIIVTDEKQNEIFRYSEGKMFTQAIDHIIIKPDKTIKWQETWDINKEELKAGFYEVKISVLAAEPNNLESTKTFEIAK